MFAKAFRTSHLAIGCIALVSSFGPLSADNLYLPDQTQSLVSDHRARIVGDTVTVIIVQSAEASSSTRSGSRRSTTISGQLGAGSTNESGNAALGTGFDGQGQTSRSERFVTQMTAKVTQVLPGDKLEITGSQKLQINKETTTVEVRGIIRIVDIDAQNRVASNRIADAQINYKGKGFVTNSGKPGLLHQIFTLFGLL